MCGLEGAHSTEMNIDTPYPVIGLITEWQTETGDIEVRDEHSDMGGTMRLGSQPCYLVDGTKTREIYGSDVVRERHRHRYEVNNTLVPKLEAEGMTISGWSQDQGLVEMVELADHPWFVACQFHPEFTSRRAAAIRCFQASLMRRLRLNTDGAEDRQHRRRHIC